VPAASAAECAACFGNLDAGPAGVAVEQFFANGGRSAIVVRAALTAPDAIAGDEAARTGLYALDAAGGVNLLSLPDAADLEPDAVASLAGRALDWCRTRRAFFLLDPPAALRTAAALAAWLGAHPELRQPNGAIYFPRPRLADRRGALGRRPVPASGALAGIYARTDGARGVWRAPAGAEAQLVGAADLEVALGDADTALLVREGINPLRAVPALGIVAWGARTLAGAEALGSDWKYVPVRRLALAIEASIASGLGWAAGWPNDARLWTEVRRRCEAFLGDLWRQGAFAGARPDDACFARCDATTVTQADIDAGVLGVVVGIAPLQPAEFVVLDIRVALAGGAGRGRPDPPP
jgi:phage tail sheath protein FI